MSYSVQFMMNHATCPDAGYRLFNTQFDVISIRVLEHNMH